MEMLLTSRYEDTVLCIYTYVNCFQVNACLAPFMVCMSPSATSPLIDKLAKEYDTEVLMWTSELTNSVQVCLCVCVL